MVGRIRFRAASSWFATAAWLAPFLAVVSLAVAPPTASAGPYVEEHFLTSAMPTGPAYATGAVVPQNPSSIGFTGGWFSSNGTPASVLATSLNYTGTNYPAESGGSLLSPTSDSRVHRLLAPGSNPFESGDAGTVYMTFLLQTGTNNGYRAFEMHNGGNDDAANRTLQIGQSSFTDFAAVNPNQFGFRVNNNNSFRFLLGAEDANVHLFLAKFVLSTTNNADAITVWNNPNLASLASDPAGGVTASGFNFVADRLGIGHFTGTAAGFDELRIGHTLTEVLSDFLYCDVNGNGVCNSSDIEIISNNMFLPGAFDDGDVDGSGTVDFADFRLFKDHPARIVGFDPPGAGGLAEAVVPEPGCLVLLGVAALVGCGVGMRRSRWSTVGSELFALVVAAIVLGGAPTARAADQDLLNDTIGFSGTSLNLRPYVTMPGGFTGIIQMTHKPNDTRMMVVTEQGSIYAINEDVNGNGTPALWFNAASAVQTATGRSMNYSGSQQGLQSVAFHPDFANVGQPGYGKLYTTMLENRPANPNAPAHFYLGNSTYGNGGADGVLAEWTYDHGTSQVVTNSYRELFRTNMPNYDHPIKLAQFNPYAESGDEDFGLLYLTHGDSNNQDSLNDDPQDRGDVLGKMLRINPLQSGADRYTIPSTNPFYASSAPSPMGTVVLGEVYAYGFRNPHNYSFNEEEEGNTRILVGDIGRSNMEEINLAVAGGNYGWPKREGTFVHKQGNDYPPNPTPNAGYIYGVSPLPGATPEPDYIYPVAQYDHNGASVALGADYTATSVASGYVIRNGSDPALDNQFIFHNFAFNHGDVYQTNYETMLDADTEFEAVNGPAELTQAPLSRLTLALDHDNNPATAPQTGDNLNTVLGTFRNDGRYGEGLQGEMYISTKAGRIYLVSNTLPGLTLTVDRGTGEMSISNPTRGNIDINSLALTSASGSLVPGNFASLAGGWTPAPGNTATSLTQSDGSFLLTDVTTGDLGDAYDAQLAGFGQTPGEDLKFQYTLVGGGTKTGYVVYTGETDVQNTIVLTVDVATGRASMLNQTAFPQEIEGYTITSDEGSINTAGWNSLDEQGIEGGDWLDSPPQVTRLTEFQEDSTTTFDDATPFDLGTIYTPGAAPDLGFQFVLDGDSLPTAGDVEYILAGDYNGDDVVDAADYTVWRNSLGSSERLANDMSPGLVTIDDYNIWKLNYGEVLPGGGGSGGVSNTVPEPATWLLAVVAALGIGGASRRSGWLGTR